MELLDYLGNDAGSDGPSALTDSETESLFASYGGDELDGHINVIAGAAHVNALGKLDDTGNVGGSEIELGSVTGEEGLGTASLFLGKHVDVAYELRT